jgi:two-component system, LytTR family, response regulator
MTPRFRTLLIDDEKLAIARLERLLVPHSDTFEVVGRASDGAQGLALAEATRPDVLFLDIEMPELTGFELLGKLSYTPLVVFATAYDAYAIRAFEENSIDYLLKPIEAERLQRTVEKLQAHRSASLLVYDTQLRQLLARMQPKKELVSISVKTGNKIRLLRLEDISYFEAEDKYVYLTTADGQKFLTGHTIGALEEKLPGAFVRISRAVLLNSTHIKEVEKYFNGKYLVTMKDKTASRLESGSSFGENLRRLFDF